MKLDLSKLRTAAADHTTETQRLLDANAALAKAAADLDAPLADAQAEIDALTAEIANQTSALKAFNDAQPAVAAPAAS